MKLPPAFHLFYATGWQDAVLHMRLTSPSNQQPQVLISTPALPCVASAHPFRFTAPYVVSYNSHMTHKKGAQLACKSVPFQCLPLLVCEHVHITGSAGCTPSQQAIKNHCLACITPGECCVQSARCAASACQTSCVVLRLRLWQHCL